MDESLPKTSPIFLKALLLIPSLLTNDLFLHMLQHEGHKQYYIEKAVSYLQCLEDVLHGIKTNIFGKLSLTVSLMFQIH